jgi:hypothetical protein
MHYANKRVYSPVVIAAISFSQQRDFLAQRAQLRTYYLAKQFISTYISRIRDRKRKIIGMSPLCFYIKQTIVSFIQIHHAQMDGPVVMLAITQTAIILVKLWQLLMKPILSVMSLVFL